MTRRLATTLACLVLLPVLVDAEDDPLAADRALVALEHQRSAITQSWEKERADLERLAAARTLANQALTDRIAELKHQLEARHVQEQTLRDSAAALLSDEALVRAAIEGVRTAWQAFVPGAANSILKDGVPMLAQMREAANAFDRLKAAAARWDIEISEGRLPDGTTVAVQVLEAGLAAAWYLQLDGHGAGHAVRSGKGWSLTPVQDPASVAAVAAAISQFRGNSVPQSVLLPAPESSR